MQLRGHQHGVPGSNCQDLYLDSLPHNLSAGRLAGAPGRFLGFSETYLKWNGGNLYRRALVSLHTEGPAHHK